MDTYIGSPTPDVNQVQFEALVSFTYNVGTAAFHTSTLLKKVQANPNDPTIRDEFMKWVGCAYFPAFYYFHRIKITNYINRFIGEC